MISTMNESSQMARIKEDGVMETEGQWRHQRRLVTKGPLEWGPAVATSVPLE